MTDFDKGWGRGGGAVIHPEGWDQRNIFSFKLKNRLLASNSNFLTLCKIVLIPQIKLSILGHDHIIWRRDQSWKLQNCGYPPLLVKLKNILIFSLHTGKCLKFNQPELRMQNPDPKQPILSQEILKFCATFYEKTSPRSESGRDIQKERIKQKSKGSTVDI